MCKALDWPAPASERKERPAETRNASCPEHKVSPAGRRRRGAERGRIRLAARHRLSGRPAPTTGTSGPEPSLRLPGSEPRLPLTVRAAPPAQHCEGAGRATDHGPRVRVQCPPTRPRRCGLGRERAGPEGLGGCVGAAARARQDATDSDRARRAQAARSCGHGERCSAVAQWPEPLARTARGAAAGHWHRGPWAETRIGGGWAPDPPMPPGAGAAHSARRSCGWRHRGCGLGPQQGWPSRLGARGARRPKPPSRAEVLDPA